VPLRPPRLEAAEPHRLSARPATRPRPPATHTHLNPNLEALSLLAVSAGLGTSVIAGHSSSGQAQEVIDYHLDRLFPASGPTVGGSANPGNVSGEDVENPRAAPSLE
jgi:hypothetical protein